MRLSNVPIESFQVEVELAEILWLEAAYLQFDVNQAVETSMEKEQIQSEISVTHLEGKLRANEAEVSTELDEKDF
jgi:hypothetical protein